MLRKRPGKQRVASLRRRLLAWYDAHRRALPWRSDRDPYRVWISEAMLQQTRVETVIPYYQRFLARFPTVGALAAAPLEDVLAVWSGLGYYSRARTLHAAAGAIVSNWGGELPSERAALLELPGIGPYTAGAIASIAFDRAEPLVDGNVARVFCRWFALADAASSPRLARELWSVASEFVAAGDRSGDWNQALMELGALVCTPRDPSCAECPVSRDCRARIEGRVSELPWPKERPRAIPIELDILVVWQRGRLLLEQRPAGGRMAELWQLPTREIVEAAPSVNSVAKASPSNSTAAIDATAHADRSARLFPADWPSVVDARGRTVFALRSGEALGVVAHTITHHCIRATVRRGTFAARRTFAPFAWVREDALGELPITGMTRKVLALRLARSASGESAD